MWKLNVFLSSNWHIHISTFLNVSERCFCPANQNCFAFIICKSHPASRLPTIILLRPGNCVDKRTQDCIEYADSGLSEITGDGFSIKLDGHKLILRTVQHCTSLDRGGHSRKSPPPPQKKCFSVLSRYIGGGGGGGGLRTACYLYVQSIWSAI